MMPRFTKALLHLGMSLQLLMGQRFNPCLHLWLFPVFVVDIKQGLHLEVPESHLGDCSTLYEQCDGLGSFLFILQGVN